MSVAAIDIGSNTVRLLILSESGDELAREETVTSLGSGLTETARFRPESVNATIEAIGGYAETMKRENVSVVSVVATSASRDATNAHELMDAIDALLGTRPSIISGKSEAELSFAGATSAGLGHPPSVVIDIGGGSTEFVYGSDLPEYAVSIDVGTVRLSDTALKARPPGVTELAQARSGVAAAFADVELPQSAATVIGVAGTFTSLAGIHLASDVYDRERVHGSTMSLQAIEGVVEMLSGMTVSETAAIPSLNPKRAPVILAGSVIATEALRCLGATEVRVSERDLLDGLAMSLL